MTDYDGVRTCCSAADICARCWGFIAAAVGIVEGHLLKNIDCKLMRQIKRVPSAARMVLTGTPLQNNLTELWALLNFVLPDLLGDLSAFQSWTSYRHHGCRVRRCGETRTRSSPL